MSSLWISLLGASYQPFSSLPPPTQGPWDPGKEAEEHVPTQQSSFLGGTGRPLPEGIWGWAQSLARAQLVQRLPHVPAPPPTSLQALGHLALPLATAWIPLAGLPTLFPKT